MLKQHFILAAVAAVAAVAAIWAGAPASTVLLITLLLACPVMMLLMMRSMGGDQTGHDHRTSEPERVRRSRKTDVS